jgi:acyl carrier protein
MAERTEIFEAIEAHLVGRGLDEDTITMKADLLRDLDLDSLDTMELTVGMEKRFGIEIPDTELEGLRTIEDAVVLIQRCLTVDA